MAGKRPGLGRGLGALIEGSQTARLEDVNEAAGDRLKTIPVDKIVRGTYQPRRHFEQEALEDLADSIREQGVLQPIVVRQIGDKYEIIAGERRWRATQLASIDNIPAVIKKLDDQAAAAVALIENIQRENLNPLEESQALQRLIDEFDLTHQEVAQAVGRSRTGVTNLLRLLELPDGVKSLVDKGALSMGHARAILALPSNKQSEVAREVASKGLSVRETEKRIKAMLNEGSAKASLGSTKKVDPDIRVLEQGLSDKLAASVHIQHASNGKGKLVINYNNLDELDGILRHIK